jgi:glycosyltransferase involved in cell wall biosynthesis
LATCFLRRGGGFGLPAAPWLPYRPAADMRYLMLNWRDPRHPHAGGAERVSRAFLRGLVERGHEVAWFSHAFAGAAPTERLDGMEIVRAGRMGTSIVAARRWVRRQRPFDLVIDQHHGLPWFAPRWCRTRVLAYIHEVCGPIWDYVLPWPAAAAAKRVERGWVRLYRRVPWWTVSESTKRQLEELGAARVTALPNGCDLEPLPALPPKPLEPPFRLITVSRLACYKRVDHAVEAVALLRTEGLAVKLDVVGGGAEAGRLQALVRRRGLEAAVRFHGAVPEVRKVELLRQAHVLVHASVREGWGLNVIEAHGQGTPTVVYPVAGLADSNQGGQTGVIVGEETPRSLASGVRALLEDPARHDGLRAAAWRAAGLFRWDSVLPPAMDFLGREAQRNI